MHFSVDILFATGGAAVDGAVDIDAGVTVGAESAADRPVTIR